VFDAIRLYFAYIAISIRGQMQYRANFFLQAFAHFTITGLEYLGLVALFQRFHHIEGWSLAEVAVFYGMISVAFAICEAVSRGFDVFARMVNGGNFDRILLRPRTAALQILGQEMQLMRVGRFAQGLMVLTWGVANVGVSWTPATVVLLVAAILGGAALFSGLIVLQATICFWTVESIEVINCATYGGVEAAQFPITIYKPWFRHIFTFFIPLATINYFPLHAIFGKPDPLGSPAWFQWLSPLVGVVFLLATLQLWRFGVRHYTSTGN
jgi:ABC-2 type transport system permease protein